MDINVRRESRRGTLNKEKNANVVSQRHIFDIPSKAQDILRYRSQARSFSLKALLVTVVKRKHENTNRSTENPEKYSGN